MAVEDAPSPHNRLGHSRIFTPEVNEDLDAVTTHLAAAGMATPRLIRTRTGER